MATEITPSNTRGASALAAMSIRDKRTDLLSQSFADKMERDQVVTALEVASEPASDAVVGREIVTLLNFYFVAALPPAQSAAVAQIWLNIIGNPPEWALNAACVWWLGPDNPKCEKKPVPGEIAARIKVEMEPLRVAQIAVDRHDAEMAPLQAQRAAE